jgi:transcriptional regulator with XRE-family HTH domain
MVPNNIATLRRAQGLTQTQLAEAIGTTLSQMGKLERGERPLDTDWLESIATALSVEPFRIIAPARLFPTEEQLADMLQHAQQKLPAGLPYSEWPRSVASGLHTRLLTLAGDRASADGEAVQA